jgi:tetratricopeptide (TPR) repeat protein
MDTRSAIAAFLLSLGLVAGGTTASGADPSNCVATAPLDLKIAGCKAVIASGVTRKDILITAHGALADAYFAKGWDLEKKGDRSDAVPLYRQALSELDAAIAVDPASPANFRNYAFRSTAHNALGELALALADATKAISMMPTEAGPYYTRGLVYKRMGKIAEARSDFTMAHQLNPAMGVPPV